MSAEKEKQTSQEADAAEPEGVVAGSSDAAEGIADEETVEAVQQAEAEGAEEGLSVEDLMQRLSEVEKKADESWEKFLRTQAEMENLRRRTEKELQSAHKFALEKFAKELLPVIDSLEYGLNAASAENADIQQLREGGELTLKQFQAALEKFNIEPLNPLGEPFNPEQHQAMAMQPSADVEPNTVLTVFQKGYMLNGRLLRPAMVVVARAMDAAPKIDEQA
ncbi:MAG: nucleotide exchange factor GrpE [Pseudomonadota bacterium]